MAHSIPGGSGGLQDSEIKVSSYSEHTHTHTDFSRGVVRVSECTTQGGGSGPVLASEAGTRGWGDGDLTEGTEDHQRSQRLIRARHLRPGVVRVEVPVPETVRKDTPDKKWPRPSGSRTPTCAHRSVRPGAPY